MKVKKQSPDVFFKKRFIKRFVKKLTIIKRFIEKVTLTQVFPCEFCGISKNTFLAEYLWMTASRSSPPKSQSYLNF